MTVKIIISFLLLFTLNPVSALDDPWDIINKAAEASKKLSYKGIFHSQHSNDIKSIEITHAFRGSDEYGSDEYTRINMLDGDFGEALADGKNVVVYHSHKNDVIMQKRKNQHLFPAIFPVNPEILKNNYELGFGDKERIAGRNSQIVVLRPLDKYRNFYHFWLDEETSIPLKMIVSDGDNNVFEQSSFTNITFAQSSNLSWFKPSIDNKKQDIIEKKLEETTTINKFWKLKNIFKEVDQITQRTPGLNILSHQLVYSDGLAYVSLFIRPVAKDKRPKIGEVRIGSTNISARYYNGYQIMSVGSVPVSTVKHFSESVEF
jgi:sigma-E factor negative regulatory protein RseB